MTIDSELQRIRNELIDQLAERMNLEFDELVQKIENKVISLDPTDEPPSGSFDKRLYSLSSSPSIFKGKKPVAVVFGEERVAVGTWKMVFKNVMLRCNSDIAKHNTLMSLRNKIIGRDRVFLSDSAAGMRSPLMIDDDLYAETHYDTETLLRILFSRILKEVNYDYSNIYVEIRHGKNTADETD